MYDLWFLVTHSDHEPMWMEFKEKYPHARKKVVNGDYKIALFECATDSLTKMFFTISDVVCIKENFIFDFVPSTDQNEYIHTWISKKNVFFDFDSVTLWPKDLVLEKYKNFDKLLENHVHHNKDDIYQLYDLFFISYNEEYADINWEKFSSRFPHAKRVDKITGIHNAHKQCANQSTTSMFYTVDADTIVDDNWDFTFIPIWHDRRYLHIWYSRNPINNLEYGYGGIKLWPKEKVKSFNNPWIDFTTSVGDLKLIDKTISTTHFNTSPYSTWKSAFREGIKLQDNMKRNYLDIDSRQRFYTWTNVYLPVSFSEWAKKGIEDSIEFFQTTYWAIPNINDFDWLKTYFTHRYPNSI